jgi:hypothetical protein
MNDTCGCGKPVRYMVEDGVFACNRHFQCLTYKELVYARFTEYQVAKAKIATLERQIETLNTNLSVYQEQNKRLLAILQKYEWPDEKPTLEEK